MVGWRYEWSSAKEGCVDCSGAFVYAMKKYGLSIYHGSNTIWREHLTVKGKIGEIELTPGMAVFRHRMDGGEPDKYRADGQGNFFHIGLFVGDGKVIEAKSSTTGVVESSVQGWTHCGKVKGIVYSDTENMGGGMMSMQAKVTTESGS